MLYVKKPIPIHAEQVVAGMIGDLLGEAIAGGQARVCEDGIVLVNTREGTLSAHPGEWLAKGVEGEFYPIGATIFAKTYVPYDDGALSFSQALDAMKKGHRAARAGWNGKNMWIALSCDGGRDTPMEQFWSRHARDYAREHGGSATVLPCIIMKTATGEILMGWLASQADMLAEDWVVFPEKEID